MVKIVIIFISLLCSSVVFAQDYVLGKIVVKFNDNISDRASEDSDLFKSHLQRRRLKPMFQQKEREKHYLSAIYVYSAPLVIDHQKFCEDLSRLPEIEWAEPYYLPKLLMDYNDPYLSQQYYLPIIKASEAHDITTGDSSIVIGIVDSGVDIYHEDLVDNFKYNYDDPINGIDDDFDGFVDNFRGWDMAYNDNNPQTEGKQHGAKVAGLASASTNNGKGIVGIGYNTKLLPVKIMNKSGLLVAAYEGVVYAVDHGCDIINLSWGGHYSSNLEREVIHYTTDVKNCLVVASCGNDGDDVPFYPASYPNVLSVAATNWNDHKWAGSSYGTNIDICAPGENVFFTNDNNSYNRGSGTSYSSPIVAGAAALLMDYFPDYTPLQIAEQLRVTGDVVDTIAENQSFASLMGKRLNVLNALTDTQAVSLRLNEVSYREEEQEDGIHLFVELEGTNYLNQVSNTTISLVQNSPYLQAISNQYKTGKLDELEVFNSASDSYEYLYNESMPFDYNLFMKFQMFDQGYYDYQYKVLTINKSFLDINSNDIKSTVASNGRIGYADYNKKHGEGFQYKGYGNFLQQGGIVVGVNSNNIASGLMPDNGFEIISKADSIDKKELLEVQSRFKPNNEALALDIEIEQKVKAYSEENLSNALIYEYIIHNTGEEDIEGFRLGMFANFVVYYKQNYVDYNDNQQMLFTRNFGTYQMYMALAYMGEGNATPYAFDLATGGNGGIDITNGLNDDLLWFAMTNERKNSYDTIEVASLLTSATYTIPVGESVTIPFAMLAGKNEYVLEKTGDRLHQLYTSLVDNQEKQGLLVSPNPAKNSVCVQWNSIDENTQLSLFSMEGELIRKLKPGLSSSLKLELTNYKKGVYILVLEQVNEKQIQKLIIQ